jgi:hypothetical protein
MTLLGRESCALLKATSGPDPSPVATGRKREIDAEGSSNAAALRH